MIHVVLCDDHAVLRRGIRDTLAEAPDIQVTGEAGGYSGSDVREPLPVADGGVLTTARSTLWPPSPRFKRMFRA